MPSESFPSNERLKSRKSIRKLFLSGHSLKVFPIRLMWMANDNHRETRAAFSAPKKQFRKASDRNRIKRLLREAYRKNKAVLFRDERSNGLDLMFIYLDTREQSFEQINAAMSQLLDELKTAATKDPSPW